MLHFASSQPPTWLPALLFSIGLLSGCSLPAQNLTESVALNPESARTTRLGQALAAEPTRAAFTASPTRTAPSLRGCC